MDVPGDFPVAANQGSAGYQTGYQTTVTEEAVIDTKVPVYKKWWLWTIVGVVVTGAVVGGVMGHYCASGTCDFSSGPADVSGGIRW
jgi:hypothetical protein